MKKIQKNKLEEKKKEKEALRVERDKEVEDKISDLSKAKITTDHIKQIQNLYKQLKDKKDA